MSLREVVCETLLVCNVCGEMTRGEDPPITVGRARHARRERLDGPAGAAGAAHGRSAAFLMAYPAPTSAHALAPRDMIQYGICARCVGIYM